MSQASRSGARGSTSGGTSRRRSSSSPKAGESAAPAAAEASRKPAARNPSSRNRVVHKPASTASSKSCRRVDREAAAPAKRSSARFLMLWTAAVLATAAAFVVHLSMRFETVRLGYEVGSARQEQRRLVEQKRLLSLEAASLREPSRVEAIARGVLRMEIPEPSEVIAIGAARRQQRAAGRVR